MEVEKSPQKVTQDQTLTVGGEFGAFYAGLLHLLCSSQIPVPTSQGDTNFHIYGLLSSSPSMD